MFIQDLQTVQNWGACIICDAFLGKYINRNQSLKKSLQQKRFYLIVFKKFSLSGATLRDTNSLNNNQLKINQFIIWKVKKGQKFNEIGN